MQRSLTPVELAMRETIDLVMRDTPTFPVFRDRLKPCGLNVFVTFDHEEKCPFGMIYRSRDLEVPVALFGGEYRMKGLLKRGLTLDYARDGERLTIVRPDIAFVPMNEADVTWPARDLVAFPIPAPPPRGPTARSLREAAAQAAYEARLAEERAKRQQAAAATAARKQDYKTLRTMEMDARFEAVIQRGSQGQPDAAQLRRLHARRGLPDVDSSVTPAGDPLLGDTHLLPCDAAVRTATLRAVLAAPSFHDALLHVAQVLNRSGQAARPESILFVESEFVDREEQQVLALIFRSNFSERWNEVLRAVRRALFHKPTSAWTCEPTASSAERIAAEIPTLFSHVVDLTRGTVQRSDLFTLQHENEAPALYALLDEQARVVRDDVVTAIAEALRCHPVEVTSLRIFHETDLASWPADRQALWTRHPMLLFQCTARSAKSGLFLWSTIKSHVIGESYALKAYSSESRRVFGSYRDNRARLATSVVERTERAGTAAQILRDAAAAVRVDA